jgi:CDP-glucose 4,6-dehydratase
MAWRCSDASQPHEAQLLNLDCSKARAKLLWRPVWTFDEGVQATAEWYRAWLDNGKIMSRDQLQNYINAAQARGLSWAANVFP